MLKSVKCASADEKDIGGIYLYKFLLRVLSSSLRGYRGNSTFKDFKKSLLNSFELGASMTLTYPRLQFFKLLRKLNRRAEASTVARFSGEYPGSMMRQRASKGISKCLCKSRISTASISESLPPDTHTATRSPGCSNS
jgi:hypothetical protein